MKGEFAKFLAHIEKRRWEDLYATFPKHLYQEFAMKDHEKERCGDVHVGLFCDPLKGHAPGCRYYEKQCDTKREPDRQFVLDLEQERKASDRGHKVDDSADIPKEGTSHTPMDAAAWASQLSSGGRQWRHCSPALESVLRERQRQDVLWGVQNHHPDRWLRILNEEIGEFCGEVDVVEYNLDSRNDMRKECVQIAAVALAMVECLDRGKWDES